MHVVKRYRLQGGTNRLKYSFWTNDATPDDATPFLEVANAHDTRSSVQDPVHLRWHHGTPIVGTHIFISTFRKHDRVPKCRFWLELKKTGQKLTRDGCKTCFLEKKSDFPMRKLDFCAQKSWTFQALKSCFWEGSDWRRCKTFDAPPPSTMLNSTTRLTECIIYISKSSYTTYRCYDHRTHSPHANLSSRMWSICASLVRWLRNHTP